jgi:hypothetical protein
MSTERNLDITNAQALSHDTQNNLEDNTAISGVGILCGQKQFGYNQL